MLGAGKIPDIIWQYCGLIAFMQDNPGMYGLDDKREELHNELCNYFNLTKEQTKRYTDHMSKDYTAADLWIDLEKLRGKNNESADIRQSG